MPDNVLDIMGQTFSVVVGALVLLGLGFAFAVRHRVRVKPGESGHRPAGEQGESEITGPSGYIDSFAGAIEDAGGSLPFVGKVVIAITLVAYLAYLILFWQAR